MGGERYSVPINDQIGFFLFLAFEIPLPACAMKRLLNSSAKVLYNAHRSHFTESSFVERPCSKNTSSNFPETPADNPDDHQRLSNFASLDP